MRIIIKLFIPQPCVGSYSDVALFFFLTQLISCHEASCKLSVAAICAFNGPFLLISEGQENASGSYFSNHFQKDGQRRIKMERLSSVNTVGKASYI